MSTSAISPETILQFWFGDQPERSMTDRAYSKLWWSKDEATDNEIRDRFGSAVEQAANGELDDWETTAKSRLTLIILTDQFPRNIYRGTAKSFAYDHLALAWCLEGIEREQDREVLPVQRTFWYLPLEHSEVIENQDQCVELSERLAAEAPDGEKAAFEGFRKYAEQHRDIIRRFGRFPHRNTILGRESTAEEEAFLKTPGSSF